MTRNDPRTAIASPPSGSSRKPDPRPQLNLRLSPEELAQVQAAAEAAGVTVTDYVRAALGIERRPCAVCDGTGVEPVGDKP